MTAEKFIEMAEYELAEVAEKTPDQYASVRNAIMLRARRELDMTVVNIKEIDEAISSDVAQFRRMVTPPKRISIPGFSMCFR
jgi:uncharacterized protein with GYD domain